MLEKGQSLIESGNREYIDAEINPEEMRMLIFTSGTTDKSKGVMLSHKNICHDIMGVSQLLTADNRDNILSILPPIIHMNVPQVSYNGLPWSIDWFL